MKDINLSNFKMENVKYVIGMFLNIKDEMIYRIKSLYENIKDDAFKEEELPSDDIVDFNNNDDFIFS